MDKFAEINYGNDWGIFIDIETNNLNNEHTVYIGGCENKKNDKEVKLVSNIFINLFICGFLAYTIYFVL